MRGTFAGGGKPAKSRRAKRSANLAFLDTMGGNAEHVGDDLRP